MTTDSTETPTSPTSRQLTGWIRRRKWWLLLLVALLFVCSAWLYSVIWYSAEIRARVVTPDGHPVVGAIVAANWELRSGIHGIPLGQLAVVEVVTDKDGEFRIRKWGPLFLPSSYGGYKRATIRIFSPNFIPLVANDFDQEKSPNPGDVSRESLQKAPFILTPSLGFPYPNERELTELAQSLFFVEFSKEPCAWKAIPRLAVAMHRIKVDFARFGEGLSFPSLYSEDPVSQARCGDPEKFLPNEFKDG